MAGIIGGVLGGAAGIIQAMLAASAQAQQAQIDYANLAFQKEQARRADELATATRTDAYGNEQGFDDALNEWFTNLSPMQQRLVNAGEHEQLLSLTEDASRDRDVKRRAEVRGREAGDVYNDLLADFRYSKPPTEGAIEGELVGLLSGARSGASNQAKQLLGQQALRLGRGGDIASIIEKSNEALGGGLDDVLLKAREGARSESASRESAHNQRFLPAIDQFRGIADAIPGSNPLFSTTPRDLSGLQGEQLSGMINTISSNAQRVGGAYDQLGNTLGKGPDLSGLVSALSGISFGGTGSATGTTRGRTANPNGMYYYESPFGDHLIDADDLTQYRGGTGSY